MELKFHHKNTSISDSGFLWLLFSSARSKKKLSCFPPGALSINHPPSKPLAGVFKAMEPVWEVIRGTERVGSRWSISEVLETESAFPFRYKESTEVFIWFADWQKHDFSINESIGTHQSLITYVIKILSFLQCTFNFSHNISSQKI